MPKRPPPPRPGARSGPRSAGGPPRTSAGFGRDPGARRGGGRAAAAPAGPPERLQKVLAEQGLGSRRQIEAWIAEGRVRVNGQVARLGDRVGDGDRIRVDGEPVVRRRRRAGAEAEILAYHKPEGELVTRRDPEDRPTVFRRLPRPRSGRWIAVGRLDINTSGLILFTTDGELANRLMHPSRAVEREYAVRILGEVPPGTLERLRSGIELEDGPARCESLEERGGSGANRWYHAVLKEGRNREVRRMWEAAGCRVSRLIRVRYGNVALGRRLFPGVWRPLDEAERAGLLALAGLAAPSRKGGRRPATAGSRGAPSGSRASSLAASGPAEGASPWETAARSPGRIRLEPTETAPEGSSRRRVRGPDRAGRSEASRRGAAGRPGRSPPERRRRD